MRADPLFVGIDVGASGAGAVVIDETGAARSGEADQGLVASEEGGLHARRFLGARGAFEVGAKKGA
jgi:hypothetical protein